MTKVGVRVEVTRQVSEVVAPGEAVVVQQLQELFPGVTVRNVPCCPVIQWNKRTKGCTRYKAYKDPKKR